VWYIFPQLKGFGRSYNSEYYGISGLEEARAYYNHPVLGSRLVEITNALLGHSDKSAREILSPIDARKVRSCMTLFWVASGNPLFKSVIDTFYEGRMDNRTIEKCEAVKKTSMVVEERQNTQTVQVIEINTEIMVEINNLCHFNEPWKVANLIKYMIPQWFMDSKVESNCIYLRHIFLRHSPEPCSSVIYEGLPQDMTLFCWKQNGIFYSICYISVVEDADFRKSFHLDFDGMDDQDCDPDELGWYYFMGKTNNLYNIVNYSGFEYAPVFRLTGDAIICCQPPVIRHKYRLRTLNTSCGNYALIQKYNDLAHSGNWNAKRAIERGELNKNG
jgi:uncharacterized protein (DUF1810 family)